MRSLPLYPEGLAPVVPLLEGQAPLAWDPSCDRCALRDALSGATKNPCMRPVALAPLDAGGGSRGTLLVVGDGPTVADDVRGEPLAGASGALLRPLLAKLWRGRVVLANAVGCAPGAEAIEAEHVTACRPYLARTIALAVPEVILALGSVALSALLGRSVPPLSARRAFEVVRVPAQRERVPVYLVQHPRDAATNPHLDRWFRADVAWALDPERSLATPHASMVAQCVESEGDAREAVYVLRERVAVRGDDAAVAFDVETAGAFRSPAFRIVSLSAAVVGSSEIFTWGRAALASEGARAPLLEWLADPEARKVGQNVKFDAGAVEQAWGTRVGGLAGDVRLWRKLLAPEAPADLATMSWLVGMGGSKDEARGKLSVVRQRAHRGRLAIGLEARRRAADDADRALDRKSKSRVPLTPSARDGLDFLGKVDAIDPAIGALARDASVDWESWAYAVLPDDVVARYNARDALVTARLAELFVKRFAREADLDRHRRRVVDPAGRAVVALERWGVPIDLDAVRSLDAYLAERQIAVRRDLDAACGAGFNPDSPKQVADSLFGKLGLRATHKTKGGAISTAEEAISLLRGEHPAVDAVLAWREVAKVRGTYVAGFLHARNPSDGRAHPAFLLDGAESGRPSCQSPNLQNVPRADSALGKMVRDCVAAPPGFLLLQLDYSQIEVRVAAMLSGDEDLAGLFRLGPAFDPHMETARRISRLAWGIAPEACTKAHRTRAKSVLFGVIYGKTARTLAEEWCVPEVEAAKVVDAIFGRYRRLSEWCRAREVEATRTGEVWTAWNGRRARRRSLWRAASQEPERAAHARNAAKNSPIQGTASDFLMASLDALVRWIDGENLEDRVQLVLPVHDSLLFVARKDLVPEVAEMAREVMVGWPSAGIPVPLEVDAEAGERWGSLEKLVIGPKVAS